MAADSKALAAGAQSSLSDGPFLSEIALSGISEQEDPIDPTRNAKLAGLKARYEAGLLTVDASILATKLVESHLRKPPLSQK
jgi:anti-sigma28 factor (negative regulator of flagellin synthesis)